MIQLAEDCLLFQTDEGEKVPYSAELISVEIMGDSASCFDSEFIKHAAAAVFHYFRDELDRDSVTVAEFSFALEKILRGFKLASGVQSQTESSEPRIVRSDLCRLIGENDGASELFFFPRLRDELRSQMSLEPQMLCFQGLRQCVKQLAGARRWSGRCQTLHDQIVEYLRSCMCQDNSGANCALVVK
ncbi:MAG TPA: hypothetical protein VFB72_09265 [Verrucomicrobiae bacterium]|nr:hypothetical protein [Verrucomicrobiae bacterium]